MDRPSIPRPLEREVLMEAGHRCATPTCKQTPVEIAHIIPYDKVLKHEFDNLITLCPNCHSRYTANLLIINSRYTEQPEKDTIQLSLSGKAL
jgi:5-methylcytosine-specific restriction endonuclease McrA